MYPSGHSLSSFDEQRRIGLAKTTDNKYRRLTVNANRPEADMKIWYVMLPACFSAA
jgi:hypothetical protein